MKNLENKEISTLEVEISIKALDKKSSRLIDVFETKAKAIKSNTQENSVIIKDNMEIKLDSFRTDEGFTFPNVLVRSITKLTKADLAKA